MIKSKKAAMNVPSKSEALEENGIVADTREKKEFVKDFRNKRASDIIDELYYEKFDDIPEDNKELKPIVCDCGYKGQPTRLGLCPQCGNVGGVTHVYQAEKQDIPYSRSRAATQLQEDIGRYMAEKWNFMNK